MTENFPVEHAAEVQHGIQLAGGAFLRTHAYDACEGEFCVVHNPSAHHMREWPLNWRGDKGQQMERICSHGVGHPDPDDLDFHIRNGRDYMGVHGCDGCCSKGKK